MLRLRRNTIKDDERGCIFFTLLKVYRIPAYLQTYIDRSHVLTYLVTFSILLTKGHICDKLIAIVEYHLVKPLFK